MPTHKFPRGFKAEAERHSVELREELGVSANAPLSPWKVAEFLGVRIYNLSDLADCPEKLYLFSEKGQSEFSATVCYLGLKAFIVNNDEHSHKRQASNIAHELAHILLRHPPTRPFDEDGKRDFLMAIEKEAEWLGPALLVSEAGAMHACRLIKSKQFSLQEISDQWQITEDVIRMRMNVTGAFRRIKY